MTTVAQKAFAAAQGCLRDCKAQMHAVAAAEELPDDISKEDYLESEGGALALLIERFYRTIVMVHEALGQSASLAALSSGFEPLRPKLGTVTYYDGDLDLPQSAGIEFLEERLITLAPLVAVPKSMAVQRRILWTMLEQTNVLMGQQSVAPAREKDVQDALEKVLILPFPDVIREPGIPKQTKTYHPDFGIQSLKAAIEVKFVGKKEDIGKAIGQLYEDMHGYNDSAAWSMFLGVIYMTGPFLSQKRLTAEARKAGIPKSWRVCVVVGPGAPLVTSSKKLKASKNAAA